MHLFTFDLLWQCSYQIIVFIGTEIQCLCPYVLRKVSTLVKQSVSIGAASISVQAQPTSHGSSDRQTSLYVLVFLFCF